MTPEQHWLPSIKELLLHQRIVDVQYTSEEDAEEQGWTFRPIQIKLSNGMWLTPTQDDEGNEGGSIHTNEKLLPVIPVI